MTRVLLMAALLAAPAYPCSVVGTISGAAMFSTADVIIRAKAATYAFPRAAKDDDGFIRFRLLENIRSAAPDLLLKGRLVDADDWNDKPAPYDFVRPSGRGGSCYTNQYRASADYLLFLKRTKDGYTTAWYPLGPVNEQLRSDKDPWLLWTKEQERKRKEQQ
jgi:hypothetical protein